MTDVKQKTKIGMLWNTIEKIVVQLISFILSIILARLLTPHDYGTIGMLSIFLTFSNVFVDSGFSRAIVQKIDRTEKDYSTVLIFSVVISCILYVILFFCSPAIASFYKIPELVPLERVFFLVIIINSLSIVQNSKLQIEIDFKKIAIINSLTTIGSGIIGIICAYFGLGPWALVIQSIARALLSSILFWFLGRWIPTTGFSVDSFKHLFGYGSKLLLSGLLANTLNCINNLVIGKYYNPESLGYYTRAQQFPELISGTLAGVLNNATFPLMSSLQKKSDELIETFKKLIRITAMFVYPAMVGIAILSKPIILVLLGDKWAFSSELLFWLALSYIFTPLSILNMNILNAIGRSDLFLKTDIAKVPIILLTMIITFPINIRAVVIGKFISAFIYYYINTFMVGKMYNFGIIKQIFTSWKYILSTLVMVGVIILEKLFISSYKVQLFICIFSGACIYMIMLFILKDNEFLILFKKILEFIKGKK